MFDFEPQVVFLSFCQRSKYDDGGSIHWDEFDYASPAVAMIRGCPYFATHYISPTKYSSPEVNGGINKVEFNGNKVSWYTDQNPNTTISSDGEQQFNGLPKK